MPESLPQKPPKSHLFRLPPDYTHADVIDSSYGHIKVLDHRGTYVSVPCTYLDIK